MAQDTCTVCNLNLKCILSGHEDIKPLLLPPLCSTVVDLKGAIEKQYCIPSCVQSLMFHGVPLSDTDPFYPTHVSKDENLTVCFPSKANVSGVKDAIEWLNLIRDALQQQSLLNSEPLNSNILDLIQQGIDTGTIQDLSVDLFYPWKSGEKYVNKLYFDDCGGLSAMCSVHAYLVKLDWNDMPQDFKFLELVCTQSITNFCQSFELRRKVIQQGGLDMCIKTLFRCKPVTRGISWDLNPMSKSAIEVALYAVCNLSELPECQLAIAKNHDITMQIIFVLSSVHYSCKLAIVAISIFTCIAQSVDSCPYLLTIEVVSGLLRACDVRSQHAKNAKDIHEMNAFRCYVAATLAVLIIPTSHQILDEIVERKVCTLMETVLSSLTPTMLEKYEDQEGLMWCSLLPYIRLFYLPTLHTSLANTMLRAQHFLSIKILLLMLHGTLRRNIHYSVVCKEGIQDYVVALPWILPAEVSQAASDFVSDFASHQPLQPPTLVNTVKARLASWHLGLDAVLSTSVRDIVAALL